TTVATGPVNVPASFTPLVLATIGLTALYSLARLTWKNYLLQARLQFSFDILLVTWLVWLTGNAASPYAALYIVIISVAGLFLGRRGTMICSVGSALAFTACAIYALNRGGISSDAVAEAIQSVGLSDISFLIVGLLAAKL